jgi:hypothetical protein
MNNLFYKLPSQTDTSLKSLAPSGNQAATGENKYQLVVSVETDLLDSNQTNTVMKGDEEYEAKRLFKRNNRFWYFFRL